VGGYSKSYLQQHLDNSIENSIKLHCLSKTIFASARTENASTLSSLPVENASYHVIPTWYDCIIITILLLCTAT